MFKTIQLIINNQCNCFCKMCDIGIYRASKKHAASIPATNFMENIFFSNGEQPLSLPEYERLIASLPAGTTVYINATEPLMSKNLFPLLKMLAGRELPVCLTTNGLLLNRLAERLAHFPITNFCVSLDGPAQVHDAIRGINGLFRQAFLGIKKLRTLRPDMYIRTSTAISHLNQHHLVELFRALQPLELNSMLINHLNFITQEMADRHNAHYGDFVHATPSCITFTPPEKLHLPALVKEILQLKTEDKKKHVHFFPDLATPEEIITYYRAPLSSSCGLGCTITSRSLSVSPTGAISLGQRCFHHDLGNVRTHDLQAVFQNNTWLQEFRAKIKAAGGYFPACTRCCGGMSGKLQRRRFPWNEQ